MSITYATYSEFTEVYSVKGMTQALINSYWLPYGALRVNECLSNAFTVPFSNNNHTARDLSIQFAYIGMLLRTRNQTDSEELKKDVYERIDKILAGNSPMISDSGEAVYSSNTMFDSWSNNSTYKNTFDMRDAEDQRVDPDLITALWSEDA